MAEGQDTKLRLVLDYRVNELCRDFIRLSGEPVNHRGVTKDIDRAWNPAAGIGNDPARVIGEQLRMRSHCLQTKVDVFADLSRIHRPTMEARRPPLPELHPSRPPTNVL